MEQIDEFPDELRRHWEHFRDCFATRTRDTSEQAYDYMRGILTLERDRHFAGISRSVQGQDGQALQHFISQSPWHASAVYEEIQKEACATPVFAQGSYLVLDESADEKAGAESAGASRQYNGRKGAIDLCQVGVVLGYVNWHSGPWTSWAMVDSELFLPEEWFGEAFAERRKKVGLPEGMQFHSKLELGLAMIRRAWQHRLPFEAVSCDELYGRDYQFRAELAALHITYAGFVPCNQRVYLKRPEIGLPKRGQDPKGRLFSRERVLNGVDPVEVKEIASNPHTRWQTLQVRHNERGVLQDRFAARYVWTWQTGHAAPRREWLIVRIDHHNKRTYALSNAPEHTPLSRLAELVCSRFFVERVLEDAKDECGWDEFEARKYIAWQHHTALTACALWFIAQQKLRMATECARDPKLFDHFQTNVLPALSTANVCSLLKAVLPLPELSKEEARRQIVQHLVNRTRSKTSRLRHRSKPPAPT